MRETDLKQEKTIGAAEGIDKMPGRRLDPSVIKEDFPILQRRIGSNGLVYLDNAATTQKPRQVIAALEDYYTRTNANVHRGLHTLAEEATDMFEATRSKVAGFVGNVKTEEIIYTRNATEAINLVAQSWGRRNIGKGDRIVLTEMEHHANLVPWIVLAREAGAELRYIPIDDRGLLDLNEVDDIISPNTKIVAVAHMSNVLGTINPVAEIARVAHDRGSLFLVDGAQSAPHLPVDVKAMGADFFVFSAHKMLGPTGVGFLYGREAILNDMEPFLYGGEMINEVRYDYADWTSLPWKFEAGTPNIAGAAGFSAALDYLNRIGMAAVREHELELTSYALNRIAEMPGIMVFGPADARQKGGVISFNYSSIHPHDMATYLDSLGIAVRAGHHCAQPLMKRLGVTATARASFYIYNTREDVDRLIDGITGAGRYFNHE
jgi:cysteine desulfurase/selenocysteine lyase